MMNLNRLKLGLVQFSYLHALCIRIDQHLYIRKDMLWAASSLYKFYRAMCTDIFSLNKCFQICTESKTMSLSSVKTRIYDELQPFKMHQIKAIKPVFNLSSWLWWFYTTLKNICTIDTISLSCVKTTIHRLHMYL